MRDNALSTLCQLAALAQERSTKTLYQRDCDHKHTSVLLDAKESIGDLFERRSEQHRGNPNEPA